LVEGVQVEPVEGSQPKPTLDGDKKGDELAGKGYHRGRKGLGLDNSPLAKSTDAAQGIFLAEGRTRGQVLGHGQRFHKGRDATKRDNPGDVGVAACVKSVEAVGADEVLSVHEAERASEKGCEERGEETRGGRGLHGFVGILL